MIDWLLSKPITLLSAQCSLYYFHQKIAYCFTVISPYSRPIYILFFKNSFVVHKRRKVSQLGNLDCTGIAFYCRPTGLRQNMLLYQLNPITRNDCNMSRCPFIWELTRIPDTVLCCRLGHTGSPIIYKNQFGAYLPSKYAQMFNCSNRICPIYQLHHR